MWITDSGKEYEACVEETRMHGIMDQHMLNQLGAWYAGKQVSIHLRVVKDAVATLSHDWRWLRRHLGPCYRDSVDAQKLQDVTARLSTVMQAEKGYVSDLWTIWRNLAGKKVASAEDKNLLVSVGKLLTRFFARRDRQNTERLRKLKAKSCGEANAGENGADAERQARREAEKKRESIGFFPDMAHAPPLFRYWSHVSCRWRGANTQRYDEHTAVSPDFDYREHALVELSKYIGQLDEPIVSSRWNRWLELERKSAATETDTPLGSDETVENESLSLFFDGVFFHGAHDAGVVVLKLEEKEEESQCCVPDSFTVYVCSNLHDLAGWADQGDKQAQAILQELATGRGLVAEDFDTWAVLATELDRRIDDDEEEEFEVEEER